MTTRWPGAVSSLHRSRNASSRLSRAGILSFRQYSSPAPDKDLQNDVNRPEKAALVEMHGLRRVDEMNPPRSTLPPELILPERGDKNIALYYYKIGRAYGTFYFTGVKAVWFNYQASKVLRERVKREMEKSGLPMLEHLKRSEFQLLARNSYDMGKLPFFGVLVATFGEWLPLLVPFIPSAVPGTCRIPKQIRGMRAKAEERRRISFRRGIAEPTKQDCIALDEAKTQDWPMARRESVLEMLKRLKYEQLHHLSCNLNNHNTLWDRVQLPPPSAFLCRGLSKRLSYITSDDKLLNKVEDTAGRLTADELAIACEERGIDVLGKREETLRHDLASWLKRQKEDQGRGTALMVLLFRRPNAWATKV